jgi:hypothetical protein
MRYEEYLEDERIDEFITSKSSKLKYISSVLDKRTRGLEKNSNQIMSRYLRTTSTEEKIDCLTGLLVLCISGLVGKSSLQSKGIKISQKGK